MTGTAALISHVYQTIPSLGTQTERSTKATETLTGAQMEVTVTGPLRACTHSEDKKRREEKSETEERKRAP